MKILLNWLISGLVIFGLSYILPGVHVASIGAALITALVLGIINAIVKPILIVLTLPITILTLGLFLLIINALLVLLASAIVPGFTVHGFLSALLFSIVLSFVNTILHQVRK